MKPNVFWYNECRGSWCHAIVEWLTADCEHIPPRHLKIGSDPVVVVFKADHIKNNLEIAKLNAYLTNFLSVLVFMTANEEGTLDPALIQHPRMRMWIQTPTRAQRQWASCGIPWGWTPGFDGTRWLERLPGYEAIEADRMLDFSFAGQVTHEGRWKCVEALKECEKEFSGCILETSGFSKGLPRHLYFELLMNTKTVPCPSGPITVDSFRVWEALECGAIPIVDGRSPVDPGESQQDYWDYIAGPGHPLRVIESWNFGMAEHLRVVKARWDFLQPLCSKWWTERKAFWQRKFQTDLEMLQL